MFYIKLYCLYMLRSRKNKSNRRILIAQYAHNATKSVPSKSAKRPKMDDKIPVGKSDEEVRSWTFSSKQKEQILGLALEDSDFSRKLKEIFVPKITDHVDHVGKGDSNTPQGDMDNSDDGKSNSNTSRDEMDTSECDDSRGDSNTPQGDMDTSENEAEIPIQMAHKTDHQSREQLEEYKYSGIELDLGSSQHLYDEMDGVYENIQLGSRKPDDLLSEERQNLTPQQPVDEITTDSIITSAVNNFA